MPAVACYSILSGRSYQEIDPEALDSFKLFWFLGDSQDDTIDFPDSQARGGKVVDEIFRGNGLGHRKILSLINKKIQDSPGLGQNERHYLRVRIKSWYDFIRQQEINLEQLPKGRQGLEFCRSYRESQNMAAGSVLTAILNWSECNDPELRKLEVIVPKFSFLSQIIDDIGDLPEDIEAQRPSYALGALRDHPNEFSRVLEEIQSDRIQKFSYRQLRELAPLSRTDLESLFILYENELINIAGGRVGVFIKLAQQFYWHFSGTRDLLYKISPSWASL